MSLSEFAVKAPTKVSMIFLLVILLGWISLKRLPIHLFPEIQAPQITTEVRVKGLSPREVERRITEPFEQALFTVRGVRDVKSISRADTAILVAEFTWDTPMNFAFLDVKKAVAEAQRNWGDDIESVNVLRYDPNARPIITLALVGSERATPEALRQRAKNILKPRFEQLPGVASVVVTGGEERELLITLNETKLLVENLDVPQIITAIRDANVNASGGWIDEGARRYLLKAVGEFQTLEDVREVVVGRRGTAPIRLDEIATTQYAPQEQTQIVRFDGKPAVGLSFFKEAAGNTVGVAKEIREETERLQGFLPKGEKLVVVQDQSRFIGDAIGEVKNNVLMGGLLAIVVLFVFLRDLRSTAVVGLAIPISVIATFTLMYFLDLSINLMTLGGLALGVGMLVDNAIVTLENIHRIHSESADAKQAAIQGSREVSGALIASTLTTIMVFLPIVYVHGVAGLLFKEQAMTVGFSLFASLLVALLLIPLLSYWLYRASERLQERSGSVKTSPKMSVDNDLISQSATHLPFFTRCYVGVLRGVLRFRWLAILVAAGGLAYTVQVAKTLPQEFFPRTPQKEVRMRVVLPPSAPISATDRTVSVIEGVLQPLQPVLENVYVRIGESEDRSANVEDPDGPNTAELLLTLKDTQEVTPEMLEAGLENFTSLDLMEYLKTPLERLPNTRAQFEALQGSVTSLIGGSQTPLLIEITGRDSQVLMALADQVKQTIADIPGIINTRTNLVEGAPEALLFLDTTAMASYGFTARSLAEAISNRLQGSKVSTLKSEAGDTNIRLKVDYGFQTVGALTEMMFRSSTGARVPLGALAEIRLQKGPREIVRRRQERVAYVMADLDRVRLSEAIQNIQTVLKTDDLPAGHTMRFSGEQRQKQEAFGNLGFALGLSVILVYMVMASIFESLVQPFLLLLTIPLAGVGVVFSLALTGQSLNVMALIGIVMLGGIVVNNGIVLLDRVNQLRAGGLDRREALIQGAGQRFRPVLMTSLTTVLGLAPLAFGLGAGAELRQAMAVSVIGGMISSTLLTLLMIPCAQSFWDSLLGAFGAISKNRQRKQARN